jgi:hypothetical protein
LSFAYAGDDQEWQSSWRKPDVLPTRIKLTVRDESNAREISTITSVHVQSSLQGGSEGAQENQNDVSQVNSPAPSQQGGAGQGDAR